MDSEKETETWWNC